MKAPNGLRLALFAVLMTIASAKAQDNGACKFLEPCTAEQQLLLNQFLSFKQGEIVPDRWTLIQVSNPQLVALDNRSIQVIAPKTYRIWLRVEEHESTVRWRDESGHHEKAANASLMLQDFDCANRMTRTVKLARYFDRSVVKGSVELGEDLQSVVPDTSEELWYFQICKIMSLSPP